jgi:ATP-dependent DNA helicase RecG
LLQNLGLGEIGKDFKINNAGLMLFGKKRDLYIRQVYVTCVLYKGSDKIKIIDRKDFRDGLFQDYKNTFKFLQQHLRLEYVIEGGGPRKEIPEIPYEALKEALLNAIIHRDYFEIGARVMVEIFDDRVEISNPGELLFEKEKIGKKTVSVARNPILFDIFNRMQLIEKVGTGLKRILAFAKTSNINVEFDIDSFFTIVFFRPGYPKEQKDNTGQVSSKYRASTEQAPSKHSSSSPHAFAVLSFCEIPKKRNEIQEHLALKHREHFRSNVLAPLLREGFLKPLISDKPHSPLQKYITTEKGKEFLQRYSPAT